MRRSINPRWLVENGNFMGAFLGADFTAEHEWGIEDLKRRLVISDGCSHGLARRTVAGGLENVRLYEGTSLCALICLEARLLDSREGYWLKQDPDRAIIPQTPELREKRRLAVGVALDKVVTKNRDFFNGELRLWPGEELAAAWDGGSFGLLAPYEKGVEKMRELHAAFDRKDIAIWLGGRTLPAFENAGLIVAIASRLPEEVVKNLREYDLDVERLRNASDATGIVARLKAAKKEFYACSPRWREPDDKRKTAHPVVYWLNPAEQDRNNYGWFTVEELDQWIAGKGPIPMKKEKVK